MRRKKQEVQQGDIRPQLPVDPASDILEFQE